MQIGLVFFIDMLWGIFPLFEAIYVFPQERAMLAKDRENDMYSLNSYFMARSLVDVPLDIIMPTVFILILAPMTHMRGPASVFLFRLLTIYLIVLTSQVCTTPYCALLIKIMKLGIAPEFFIILYKG